VLPFYVAVSQNRQQVEVQRRNANGVWEIREYGPGQRAVLESLDVTISVDALYRDPLAE
jgi:Uma2 family endonuclease